MPYLIYLRKSRQDADLEALGIDVLERHEKTLLELAKSKKLLIGGMYREVVSGDSIDSRPEMIRLLSEVESGIWDGVLVMEVERLARGDTIDQGRVQRAFTYSNTLIITPAKTYNPADEFDNEYFEFSLFMSRREYATIKRRMQSGRVRSSKDGFFAGNVPPYGWKRVRADDGKHYSLVPDEKEAPVLHLIYELVGEKKYGCQKACHILTDQGIRSRSGKPFNPSTLHGIISNPANIGKVRWGWRATKKTFRDGHVVESRPKAEDYILAEAAWEPQISLELFEAANTRTSAFSAPIRRDRPLQNPFAGIVRCNKCGHVMVRKKAHTKSPYDMLICNYTGCPTVGIRMTDFEDAVIEWLKKYIKDYEFQTLPDDFPNISAKESVVHNFESEHDALMKQRESLFDFLEQGIYSKEIFLERSTNLENRIKECKKNIENARIELDKAIEISNNIDNFVPRCKNILDKWEHMDSAEKNSALKTLVEKIYFSKDKKCTKSSTVSDFSLDVYPKVPR